MRFALSDEQQQLSDTVRKAVAGRDRPARALWDGLAEMGILGLGVAESRGGSGGGLVELGLAAEQLGASLAPVPFAAGPVMAGLLLNELEGPDADALLLRTAGGDPVVAAALTLPGFHSPTTGTSLLLADDGRTLQGRLAAVPYFGSASGAVVVAAAWSRTGPVVVAFDLDAEGVIVRPVQAMDESEPLASVSLDRATARLLAWYSDAAEALAYAVDAAAAVLALELSGTGAGILELAVAYAKEREQFGRPIGSFQALKHMLADRFVQLDAARALALYACGALDADLPDARLAARASLAAAADAAHAAAGDGLQAFGGIGFTREHPAHRYLRRTRARRPLVGTPAHRLAAVADVLESAQAAR